MLRTSANWDGSYKKALHLRFREDSIVAVEKTFAGYARKISGLSGRIHQFSLWMKQTAHTMRNLSGLSRKVSRQIGAIAGKIRKYSRKISVLKSLGKNRGKIGRLAKSVADVVEKRL